MDMMITLFLCGDVMLARGIDQIHQHSVEPQLHESYVKDARHYVEIAEAESGEIPRNVKPAYVWGDALAVLDEVEPAARIINLETAVTTSADHQRGKGIHYRMHPKNAAILEAAEVDVAVLANNHVLDWGTAGLRQTLAVLDDTDVAATGAGVDDDAAEAPAIVDVEGAGRVLVFAFAMSDSGVPRDWAAMARFPGVNYLPNLSNQSVQRIAALVEHYANDNDLVVFSVHWGGNWGYAIAPAQRRFARALIDHADIDVVHGHSSHHVKGIEVYKDRPIIYGAGDFLNDYEGIGGHEKFHPELTLMYLPTLNAETGQLEKLRLAPMRIHKFRLQHANAAETRWLVDTLNEQSKAFGVKVDADDQGMLEVTWDGEARADHQPDR